MSIQLSLFKPVVNCIPDLAPSDCATLPLPPVTSDAVTAVHPDPVVFSKLLNVAGIKFAPNCI